MQNSGLNFAKLLATEEKENDQEEPIEHNPARTHIIPEMPNTVSLNDWMNIILLYMTACYLI
jgi:hypothetical protein